MYILCIVVFVVVVIIHQFCWCSTKHNSTAGRSHGPCQRRQLRHPGAAVDHPGGGPLRVRLSHCRPQALCCGALWRGAREGAFPVHVRQAAAAFTRNSPVFSEVWPSHMLFFFEGRGDRWLGIGEGQHSSIPTFPNENKLNSPPTICSCIFFRSSFRWYPTPQPGTRHPLEIVTHCETLF